MPPKILINLIKAYQGPQPLLGLGTSPTLLNISGEKDSRSRCMVYTYIRLQTLWRGTLFLTSSPHSVWWKGCSFLNHRWWRYGLYKHGGRQNASTWKFRKTILGDYDNGFSQFLPRILEKLWTKMIWCAYRTIDRWRSYKFTILNHGFLFRVVSGKMYFLFIVFAVKPIPQEVRRSLNNWKWIEASRL